MTMDRGRYRRDMPPIRPLRDLDELRRRFEQDIARPFVRAVWDRIPEEDRESWEARWTPPVDVIEKSDHILVVIELPGMRDDVDLSVSEDTLTVKGKKKGEAGDVNEEDYFRREIASGTFYRAVNLPVAVNAEKVDAVYDDGVLRVILPKLEGSKAHKINVSIKKES